MPQAIEVACPRCGDIRPIVVDDNFKNGDPRNMRFYLDCDSCSGRFLIKNFELPKGLFLDAFVLFLQGPYGSQIVCPSCGSTHKNLSSYKRCIGKHLKPYLCMICENERVHTQYNFTRVDDCIKHIKTRHYPGVRSADLFQNQHYRMLSESEMDAAAYRHFQELYSP